MGILTYATLVVSSVLAASTLVWNVWQHCAAKLSLVFLSLIFGHVTCRFRIRHGLFALALEPSVWKLHPYYTIAGILFFLAEGALIGVLLVESKQRRLAQVHHPTFCT